MATFDSKTETAGYTGGYLPNPMSAFPSTSYSLRLSLVHPEIIGSLNPKPEQKVIIAETGATGIFNITDLEIAHVMGWGGETRSANGQMANITITEVNGCRFFDYLIRACEELNIQNYINATYLLEVEFTAGEHDAGEDVNDPNARYYFVYPMRFTDVNMQVSEKGATYFIKAVDTGFEALSQLGADIKQTVEISAKTLGEFIDKFAIALNKNNMDEVKKGGSSLLDTYTLTIPDDWKKFKFDNLNTPSNPKISRDLSNDGSLLITFQQGSSIIDIINTALSATVEIEKLPTIEGFALTDPDGKPIANLSQLHKFYRLRTVVKFGDYDKNRETYQRYYTFSVIDQIIPMMQTPEELATFNNQEVMTKRVRNLLSEGLLRKRYDYYFTGLNTEILRFDINLDASYYRLKPIRDGHVGSKESLKGSVFNMIKNADPRGDDASNVNDPTKSNVDFSARPTLLTLPESATKSLPSETQSSIRNANRYFLEWYGLPENKEKGKFAVPSEATGVPNQTRTGIMTGSSPGAIKFGSVYADLSDTSDLTIIDIEIKGDPFWLGMSNLTDAYRKTAADGLAQFALYDKGANLFWLNVNSPGDLDMNTGEMDFQDSFAVSGLFAVDKVISRFTGGAFTQNLEARKDTGTNYTLAKKELAVATEIKEDEKSKESTSYGDPELQNMYT